MRFDTRSLCEDSQHDFQHDCPNNLQCEINEIIVDFKFTLNMEEKFYPAKYGQNKRVQFNLERSTNTVKHDSPIKLFELIYSIVVSNFGF